MLALESDSGAVVRVRDARCEGHDRAVGLLVELLPRRRVGLLLGLIEQVVDLRVLEAPLIRRGLEERADEVVRIGEVRDPADQVQVPGGAAVDPVRRSPGATEPCEA